MAYTFFRIDKDAPNLPSLAAKYKELRLAALQNSPASFSSTYETEAQFSDEVWLSRINTPNKETFICAAVDEGSSGSIDPSTVPLEKCEWVAQVTLLGPVSADDYALPSEASQPDVASDKDEEKWQMLSLYTLPQHRGKGLGKRLCKETFQFLASSRREYHGHGVPKQVRVRIMVKPDNHVTLGLYRSMGFVDAGTCTLEEALRANGDADLLPPGLLPEKFKSRSGKIMALVLDRV
ncbi:unnamed protein product [Clonostachys solani]|uniref:N-acetyltransferase domain-containing protein n=1 Tax=Clonostachys solani TaxID=160281 RepID=A0A9N9VXR0_9HYPO|nr:unnamed protein product [Clonostachys solani]